MLKLNQIHDHPVTRDVISIWLLHYIYEFLILLHSNRSLDNIYGNGAIEVIRLDFGSALSKWVRLCMTHVEQILIIAEVSIFPIICTQLQSVTWF